MPSLIIQHMIRSFPDSGIEDIFDSRDIRAARGYARRPVPIEKQDVIRMNRDALTREKIGTRYVFVSFRTFMDLSNPEDVTAEILNGSGKFPEAQPVDRHRTTGA